MSVLKSQLKSDINTDAQTPGSEVFASEQTRLHVGRTASHVAWLPAPVPGKSANTLSGPLDFNGDRGLRES